MSVTAGIKCWWRETGEAYVVCSLVTVVTLTILLLLSPVLLLFIRPIKRNFPRIVAWFSRDLR